jgi:hypothetical protein
VIRSDESWLLYCTDHSAQTSSITVVARKFSARVHSWIIIIKINWRLLCFLGYFMFFLLAFHKCLDVCIESVLSNWDSTVWGNRQCCLMVSLFKLMLCATSRPVSVRYIFNIIPHLIVIRSFSHRTAVDNLVEKHEGHVSFWWLGVVWRAILIRIWRN